MAGFGFSSNVPELALFTDDPSSGTPVDNEQASYGTYKLAEDLNTGGRYPDDKFHFIYKFVDSDGDSTLPSIATDIQI